MSLGRLSSAASHGLSRTLATHSLAFRSTKRPHPSLTHAHAHTRHMTLQSDARKSTTTSLKALSEDQFVLRSEYPDLTPATEDYSTSVLKHLPSYGNTIAIECGVTGRSYTYAGLQDATLRWASALQALMGDTKGTVAILMPNCPEYPIVMFGTMATGAVVTTINAAYTPGEVARQIADSGASILVVESLLEPVADAAFQLLGKEMTVVVNGPSSKARPNLREVISNPAIPFLQQKEISLDSVAFMPYSSGTTGTPKGVAVTHASIVTSQKMIHNPASLNLTRASGGHQDVLMGLMPFFHIYGMCVIMASGLIHGAKIITLPKFEPALYIKTIKTQKTSVLHTVPPLIKFVAMCPAITAEDLLPIHTVMCGAAPVPIAAVEVLKKKAQHPIQFQEGYGMTETLCTHLTPKGFTKLGSFGKLSPSVMAKIVDLETGMSLPAGEEGELYVHTPALMSGYHNNREATLATIDEDGWLHTGDVAKYDDEGYFYMVDRIKELIKVKGLQVSPSELEEVLMRHPDIADVGVIGVEDDRMGEAPRAYVVPRGEGLTEESIQAFMKDKVAVHKQLSGGVRFVKELPRNMTGKLLRRQLQQTDRLN